MQSLLLFLINLFFAFGNRNYMLLFQIIDIKINVEKFSKLEKQMGPPGDIRPKARLKFKYTKKTKPHSWLGKNDASKGPSKNVEDDLMTLYTVPRYKIVPYLLTVPCKIFHPSSISFQVKVFYARYFTSG